MKLEITVPTLPESIIEATVASVLKKEGEYIKKNDTIIDLETDKIMLSITAQKSGLVDSVLVAVGDTVKADQKVAVINLQENNSHQEMHEEKKDEALKRYGPSVRKTIEKKGINLTDVQGSGKKGRVYKTDLNLQKHPEALKDIILHEESNSEPPAQKNDEIIIAEKRNETNIENNDAILDRERNTDSDESIPMSKIRIGVVKNLLQAQNNCLTLTTFDEINMENIVNVRELYKEKFLSTHNVRLGFTSFFIKAIAQASKCFPAVNSSIEKNSIVYHKRSDIGITINSPTGTVTPIVREVENMRISDIEKRILEFSKKAKKGNLTLEEICGGTFTVTNGGFFGSMLSTPIINTPQNAILSMHKIKDRPYVVRGEIKIRPIMYVALSYNYSVIDNKYAADFLSKVKELLEDPYLLLLDT